MIYKLTKEYIKENLRRLRRANGLTCQQLADLLGVSKQCISLWELKKSPMNDVTAYGIIYIFENVLDYYIFPNPITIRNRS